MKNIGWIPYTTIIWNKKHTSARTSWGSFRSPSSPSFPTPFEYILVFSKDSIKLHTKGITDITKEEFINWSLAIWELRGENSKQIGHPAPFPIDIPYRCIKLFSWVDNIIYDPFSGSGTTCLAASILKRKYIGSEISSKYCMISDKRINEFKNLLF
jgi:site-specific DNA-methyltransferase (adenine-specific)